MGDQEHFVQNQWDSRFQNNVMNLKPHCSKAIVSQFQSDFREVEGAPNMPLEGHVVSGLRAGNQILGDQEPFAQNTLNIRP